MNFFGTKRGRVRNMEKVSPKNKKEMYIQDASSFLPNEAIHQHQLL